MFCGVSIYVEPISTLHFLWVCREENPAHYANLPARFNIPQYLICPADVVFYYQTLLQEAGAVRRRMIQPSAQEKE
jgi:hypothetical protein